MHTQRGGIKRLMAALDGTWTCSTRRCAASHILRTPHLIAFLLTTSAAAGCDRAGSDRSRGETSENTPAADMIGEESADIPADELERGRRDPAWRQGVSMDTGTADFPRSTERQEQISAQRVNAGPTVLPLGGDSEGPSVLRVQILLDRAHFSPGVIDGRWGRTPRRRCTGSRIASSWAEPDWSTP